MSLARRSFGGIAASPGIAIGRVIVFDRVNVPIPRWRVAPESVQGEVERLERAMDEARREFQAIRDALPEDASSDHRLLLETQVMMHGDELLKTGALLRISEDRINAEWALRRTVDEVAGRLRAAPEAYFRERADDVMHVGEHLLRVMTGVSRALPELLEPSILVASDLSPAEAAQLPSGHVLAIVTDAGSASSHTAILARALQVPAVVGVTDVTRHVGLGDLMIVDALRGEVVILPDEEERRDAEQRRVRFSAFEDRLRDTERHAAETLDGQRVALLANVELELDAGQAKNEGADGIGLYRTEFLYLDRDHAPSEAEQTAIYRRVARRLAPRPVTFRTFDLGADKMPLGIRRGDNPALGLRALRLAFERPELLVTQLRALLRAATEGNVQIMFPMVASVTDLRRAKVLLERARRDLDAGGSAYGPVRVGSMLEVPSAVIVADRLAPECDFFSIGTNDLTQYTLAVDRTDPRVAHLGSALHPAVLRLIDRARRVAAEHDTPISLCGDLAADPVAIPILIGLGFDQLSMSMAAIPLAREVVRRIDRGRAAEVATRALEQDCASDVERLIAATFGDDLSELWVEHGIELPRG